MKHHLGIWPVPLTERPQPLGGGEGVGGTFTGIISPPCTAKSSIFESCWIEVSGANRREQGKGGTLEHCATPGLIASSNEGNLLESVINLCIIGFESSFKEI